MVESIMVFALGFIAATLIALLIIPAINARAERLARRRAEALFPMSVAELTAEKDHLRAEFAVEQRRIERKAEEALATRQHNMEELGRRAVRIETLEEALTERDRTIALLESTLAQTQERLNATESSLSETAMQLSDSRATQAALENAHSATLDELSETRMELDLAQKDRTDMKTSLILAEEKLARMEAAHADMDRRLNETLSDSDTKRITISDLETRLMVQKARADDFERGVNERQVELTEERLRLTELADALVAAQDKNAAHEERLRSIEAERDAMAERLAALSEIERGDENLRRQITEIADRIMESAHPGNGKAQNGRPRRQAAK